MNRRSFLQLSVGAALSCPWILRAADNPPPTDLSERIRGLMFGTALGDALGGPIEFQARDAVQRLTAPLKIWGENDTMDEAARVACAQRLQLRSYRDLRPVPESYGQWNHNSPPGTITDDTRHKLVLLYALRMAERKRRWPLHVRDLAQAYLDWPKLPAITARPEYVSLAADWLEEWQFAARWVLGDHDLSRARPPERMWQSLPTCCGQMTLLPVAALFAGQPERAYRAAWHLGFFDNGFGRDLNAGLVAALAQALVTPASQSNPRAAWGPVLSALRDTDPFGFAKIRWTQRAVHRWLDFAMRAAKTAEGQPARMFAVFEKEFAQNSKWEAQVPFAVIFGCLAMADFHPLAALQLSMEWGHDTDSFAQLLGAFIGALHGPDLFRGEWRLAVAKRLKADFEVDLEDECKRLTRLMQLGRQTALVRDF
jgi:ADP-ribosylglycohydrolase